MPLLPSPPKAIRHVFLTEYAMTQIGKFAAKRGRNEVGGPMVGYMTVDHALVVTNVAGPGPRGECLPTKVKIDGRFATSFCAEQAALAKGAVRYVGDWHIHSADDANPSSEDWRAIAKLPALNEWGYPVVSLILSADLTFYSCIHRGGAAECSVLGFDA